jgi:hypothetical protein
MFQDLNFSGTALTESFHDDRRPDLPHDDQVAQNHNFARLSTLVRRDVT